MGRDCLKTSTLCRFGVVVTLSPLASIEEADWLCAVDVLSGTVGGLLPVTFEYVAAVEHLGYMGTLPEDRATELALALRGCSDPSGLAYFSVWNGWAGSVYASDTVVRKRGWRQRLPRSDGDRPDMVYCEIPNRIYFMFEGSLEDATVSHHRRGFQSASMWWPADRRWFVATEVDAEVTYIGMNDRGCQDAILGVEHAHLVGYDGDNRPTFDR